VVELSVTSTQHVRKVTAAASRGIRIIYLVVSATMATIAGPRPSLPRHVGTLADVTNSHANSPLRRTQRKQGTSQESPSLRASYLAASASQVKKVRVLPNLLQQVAMASAQKQTATSSNTMAASHGHEVLSSAPPSSSSSMYSVATSGSVTSHHVALAETQSGPVSLYRS
jgi:hypothetical protein